MADTNAAPVAEAPKEAPKAKKADAPLTDKQKALAEAVKQLASQGFDASDLVKVIGSLRKSGEIKGKGKGKSPEDTPLKVEIRGILAANKSVMDQLGNYFAASDSATSLLVKLTDNISANFIKKIKRAKKAKVVDATDQTAVANKEAEFSEPALA